MPRIISLNYFPRLLVTVHILVLDQGKLHLNSLQNFSSLAIGRCELLSRVTVYSRAQSRRFRCMLFRGCAQIFNLFPGPQAREKALGTRLPKFSVATITAGCSQTAHIEKIITSVVAAGEEKEQFPFERGVLGVKVAQL